MENHFMPEGLSKSKEKENDLSWDYESVRKEIEKYFEEKKGELKLVKEEINDKDDPDGASEYFRGIEYADSQGRVVIKDYTSRWRQEYDSTDDSKYTVYKYEGENLVGFEFANSHYHDDDGQGGTDSKVGKIKIGYVNGKPKKLSMEKLIVESDNEEWEEKHKINIELEFFYDGDKIVRIEQNKKIKWDNGRIENEQDITKNYSGGDLNLNEMIDNLMNGHEIFERAYKEDLEKMRKELKRKEDKDGLDLTIDRADLKEYKDKKGRIKVQDSVTDEGSSHKEYYYMGEKREAVEMLFEKESSGKESVGRINLHYTGYPGDDRMTYVEATVIENINGEICKKRIRFKFSYNDAKQIEGVQMKTMCIYENGRKVEESRDLQIDAYFSQSNLPEQVYSWIEKSSEL